VAGAKFLVTDQMPDERRKTRIKRPASHTTLDGELVIPRGGDGLQEGVEEVESSLLETTGDGPELGARTEKAATDLHGFSRIKSEEKRSPYAADFADFR
jgi:hypothetical protein